MSSRLREKLRRQVARDRQEVEIAEDWYFNRIYYIDHPIEFIETELIYRNKPIRLSRDQREFILDVAVNGVNFSILRAGRGAGKTFILSCYITWRITTHDNYGVVYMGGAFRQAQWLARYFDTFILESEWVRHWIDDDLKEWKASTALQTYVTISSCAETATRGPHPSELVLDELCSAEKAGNLEVIRSTLGQMMGGSGGQPHIIKTSTAHWLHGDFVETWNNADLLGYRRYEWATAEWDGEKWIPREGVHWITQEQVDFARRQMTQGEWEVEVMGGIGEASGMVFKPEDIDRAVRLAEEELDGKETYEIALLPNGEPVSYVYLGLDFGRVHPTVATVVQQVDQTVRVVHNEEWFGERYESILNEIEKLYGKYKVETVFPDPSGEMMNQKLQDKAVNIVLINTVKENQSLFTNLVFLAQKGLLRIPAKFNRLIQELKMLSYDERGNIRKKSDDHPDSLKLACSEYRYLRESDDYSIGGTMKIY